MSDGRIVIDTELDSSGLESAIGKLAGAFAIKELTEKVVQLGSDFESTMSQVSAISGATGKDFEALTQKAKEMGAKTKFSANDCAEAMTYMALAGWKSGDMISGLDGILNLAAASGENLGSVSDIVTKMYWSVTKKLVA